MAEQATSSWCRRDAWAAIIQVGQIGAAGEPGVKVQLPANLQLATLIATTGSTGLERITKQLVGLDLPRSASIALSATHGLAWSGPGQWMLLARQRAGFSELTSLLSDEAAVSDQGDARAALCVSGRRAREVLAKGAMIDLHGKAFPVGATALTSFAHVGVQLWRIKDGPDGPAFEILVSRSMAASFWSWFAASAAEFGCNVARPG
ncbi:sarcosine oxidase subunit gamma [Bradyrhizobium canariense]|uniref:sarcosine oxidase subunit gamma n=1 Tax=Bradyrhizobium canariense TaxID=255045 RepID=UPI001CA4DA7D|nr:sarcosine oxidase subunit gamma family protein [Bradyrhizobium canariense]